MAFDEIGNRDIASANYELTSILTEGGIVYFEPRGIFDNAAGEWDFGDGEDVGSLFAPNGIPPNYVIPTCERGEIHPAGNNGDRVCFRCETNRFSYGAVVGEEAEPKCKVCDELGEGALCFGGDEVRTRAGYWRDNAGRTVTITDEAGDTREATVVRRFPGHPGSGEGDTFNVEFSDDGTVETGVTISDVELGVCDLDPSGECFHKCPNYWQCEGSHHFANAVEFTCGNLGDLQPFDFGVVSESTAAQLRNSIDSNDDTSGISVIIGGYENTIRMVLPLPLALSDSFLRPETMDSQNLQNAVIKFYDCVDRYNGSYLIMLEDIHRNVYNEGEFYDMLVRQEEGCASGYVGNLCHQCEAGFTKSANICVQCPAGYESIGYALIVIFFVLFGAVIHIMIRSQYETTKKPSKVCVYILIKYIYIYLYVYNIYVYIYIYI
jgi:hypothetical protein